MLIGAAGDDGRFVPNKGMVNNLAWSIDVRQADASVPADKERILAEIEANEGGFGAIDRLAIGAISGAAHAMDQPAVLAAVGGDESPLAALQSEEALGEATRGAAAAGFLEPLRALLARGAPVESATSGGRTPLILACQGGHERCARALLEAGAQIDYQRNTGSTALMIACEHGHELCARALLEAGADKEKANNKGWTPLMKACSSGHDLCARALLEAKAAIDSQNNEGVTALMLSCHYGHEPCARALLEAGASKDIKNSAGDTAATQVQQALAGAHVGVRCDRSGMNPIVGNRYTLQGEDLCESEFQKLTSQEQREWECIPPLTPPASLSVIAVLLAA